MPSIKNTPFSAFKAVTLVAVLYCLFFVSPVFATPNIQTWNTINGVRVYYVHAPELPMVDMRVVFDAGSARDGDLPGLALLTNGLLAEGAGGLNADQIAARFESIGAQFGNNTHRDMATVELRTLTEKKIYDNAVDPFSLIVNKPDFPANALERERRRLLVGLQHQQQEPDALAEKAFYRALYNEHPYHSQPSGDEDSIPKIQEKDLQDFYKRYYVGNNAIFAIVGDINRAQAEQLAMKIVGQLPAGQVADKLPEVAALDSASTIRIEFPSAQTHILMGQPGMQRGDPDYFPLYVGNHMLGGSGLVARLSNEVREKRGLAYSTYSYFLPMRKDGPYQIGVQTRNESAEESLQVLRETVGRFIEEGPSAEELEAARKNITGGFPLRIASNKNILDYIAMIGFYQLPLDYLQTFNDNVMAVSIDDIKRAFARRVHLDRMVTVMVGAGVDSQK